MTQTRTMNQWIDTLLPYISEFIAFSKTSVNIGVKSAWKAYLN